MREKEVQWICVAQTEAPSKFHANVGQVNICFAVTAVKNKTHPVFSGCTFAEFFIFSLQGKTSRPASKEPFLQPEQRAADRRENERSPEVLGRVSNSPVDQYMNFNTLPQKQNKTGESLVSTNCRVTYFHTNKQFDTELSGSVCSPSVFPRILQNPVLLSDSCLHLFLQTQLSVSNIEACAAGRSHYSVAQAVQGYGLRRFHSINDLQHSLSTSCDSDSDRYCHTLLFNTPKLLI